MIAALDRRILAISVTFLGVGVAALILAGSVADSEARIEIGADHEPTVDRPIEPGVEQQITQRSPTGSGSTNPAPTRAPTPVPEPTPTSTPEPSPTSTPTTEPTLTPTPEPSPTESFGPPIDDDPPGAPERGIVAPTPGAPGLTPNEPGPTADPGTPPDILCHSEYHIVLESPAGTIVDLEGIVDDLALIAGVAPCAEQGNIGIVHLDSSNDFDKALCRIQAEYQVLEPYPSASLEKREVNCPLAGAFK